MTAYERFEKLCELKGITPYRVCKDLGWGTATTSNWKAGRSILKQDKMQRLADYLGVTSEYIYGTTVLVRCPVCGYKYDPLERDLYHDSLHAKYLKAVDDFGELDFQDAAFSNARSNYGKFLSELELDKSLEYFDRFLDYSFMVWLWENNFNYKYTSDFRYKWKQRYVDEKIRPDIRMNLYKCNYIRKHYFVDLISEEEQEKGVLQRKANIYDEWFSDRTFADYIVRLWELPEERKQNIYRQIRFEEEELKQSKNEQ